MLPFISSANIEIARVRKSNESEIAVMKAALKKEQTKTASLEMSLQQKVTECSYLAATSIFSPISQYLPWHTDMRRRKIIARPSVGASDLLTSTPCSISAGHEISVVPTGCLIMFDFMWITIWRYACFLLSPYPLPYYCRFRMKLRERRVSLRGLNVMWTGWNLLWT